MFGMLDYRAHKLYKVLVFPVMFVLGVFAAFGLPLIAYLIATKFSSERIIQLLLAAVILLLLGIPWMLIVKILLALPLAIFNFLIDPVPAEGRNKDEAQLVVQAGQKGIWLLKLNKPASEWSDEGIDRIATINLTSKLFQTEIRRRIYAIRNHYIMHPELPQSEYNTNKFLKEKKLSVGFIEAVITNPMWRTTALQTLALLVIFIINSH